MKKLNAIIAISLLASVAVSAQNVNSNKNCNANDNKPLHHSIPQCIVDRYTELPWHCLQDAFCVCPDFEPGEPEMDRPEFEIPDVPETDLPDVETPDAETPDIPSEPETDLPEAEEPEEEITQSSYAKQVLDLVNEERLKVGRSPLTYDTQLETAANIRAVEIKQSFSHTRPDGTSCFTTLDEIGYKYGYAGENIAYGQKSPQEVVEAWMNSQGHRENILNENFTHLGVGVYESGSIIYWAQMFASK